VARAQHLDFGTPSAVHKSVLSKYCAAKRSEEIFALVGEQPGPFRDGLQSK
jgi:hypothetical protein